MLNKVLKAEEKWCQSNLDLHNEITKNYYYVGKYIQILFYSCFSQINDYLKLKY